jgi:hypothetical protein
MKNTYGDEKYLYSVDMMIAYVNEFKPRSIALPINIFESVLDEKMTWGNPSKNIYYSPNDVIYGKHKKYKEYYKEEMQRIINSNLKYPILIHNGYIIDGVHRYVHAILSKKKKINCIIIDTKLMNKFKLVNYGEWEKLDSLNVYDIMNLYNKRFHK